MATCSSYVPLSASITLILIADFHYQGPSKLKDLKDQMLSNQWVTCTCIPSQDNKEIKMMINITERYIRLETAEWDIADLGLRVLVSEERQAITDALHLSISSAICYNQHPTS